jgi:hypothetical protein
MEGLQCFDCEKGTDRTKVLTTTEQKFEIKRPVV